MDTSASSAPKKSLPQKRSIGSKHSNNMHSQPLDSPAYDASEEDNDPLTDDGASIISAPRNSNASRSMPPAAMRNSAPLTSNRARHALASSLVSSDEGVDSPTYDGDIESSTTAGPDDTSHARSSYASSIASTLSPVSTTSNHHHHHNHHQASSDGVNPSANHSHRSHPHTGVPRPTPSQPTRPTEPLPASVTTDAFNPANLTPDDIQENVQKMIASEGLVVGSGDSKKIYKINEPPQHRPVRIYADGVYDLFHFGHALQLRQAKLSFPSIPNPNPTPTRPSLTPTSTASSVSSPPTKPGHTHRPSITVETAHADANTTPGVYLLVGVNSDQQCQEHKSRTVMSHAERCESVRHCRWVDEVVAEAPWVIDEEFLAKHNIDYVAHDQDPYGSAGHDDVYAYCKTQGKFLPTSRTPGISTSDLLARLVSGYRHRAWDKKLEKMGLRELMAEGSDWDESRIQSRVASADVSRAVSPDLKDRDKDLSPSASVHLTVPGKSSN